MSGNPYQQNPYQSGPSQEYGYGNNQQQNPYAQDQQQYGQYEMQDLGNNGYAEPTTLSQQEFLNRVQKLRNDIKGLTGDIDLIAQLHQRTLSGTDGQVRDQLEQVVTQTQIRNTAIKDGIKGLERDLSKTTDSSRNTKNTQLQSLKTFFKSELDKYQSIERDYQNKFREQIARQYRIVNPDATDEEVQQATEADWGNEGVFQTALRTNRTGHASSILGNVRARHNELQRIEQTLVDLSALYADLASMVEQQDEVVAVAENNAQDTVVNMEKGNEQVEVGIKHARNTRKLKWWCLGITVLIIIIIVVVVVAWYFTAGPGATKKN
ncbi:unnamed protein product [Clonostachys rosea]|uniref:t-SNARE coiled-coil homology domain-containing protein n=1 Tax=Bionectria ochroleuca TaxID=29856 RepID=A0ABY6TNT9_BIOOC|nr:unnamed protein product [Clonostachys rosea]